MLASKMVWFGGTKVISFRSKITHFSIILSIVAFGTIPSVFQFYHKLNLVELNESNGEDLAFNDVFSSNQVQISLLLSVIITIPMVIEILTDSLTIAKSKCLERMSFLTRVVFVFSMTIPNLILLVTDIPHQYADEAYFSATAFVDHASRGCLLMYLCQDPGNLDIGIICISTAIYFGIGIFTALTNNFDNETPISRTSTFFIILAYCQFLYIFAKWGRNLYRSKRKYDSHDLCSFVLFFALIFNASGCFFIDRHFQHQSTPESLSTKVYLNAMYLVIVTSLPSQVAKFNLRKCLNKMEEKEAFIRYISHEIRTPLNTVFLGMSFIKTELMGIAPLVSEYVEPILETVNEVNNCCEVALSIVNDLLTFDKLEEGKMAVELKETVIVKYITDTVKPFDIQAKAKNIMITVKSEDDEENSWGESQVLRVDQNKMSQVIRNLVSNAIKFTPDGGQISVNLSRVKVFVKANRLRSSSGIKARLTPLGSLPTSRIATPKRFLSPVPSKLILNILKKTKPIEDSTSSPLTESNTTSVRKGASILRGGEFVDYIRIEVKDSGVGISDENQQKLFGQYVQFNAGKLQQGNGSGLGLYISKGITELHGGCIGASSDGEGKGSTFFLELPMFPKEIIMLTGRLAELKHRSIMSLNARKDSYRKESYSMNSVGIHPHTSGVAANISIADLVSLNRKIQRRNNSSEYISEYDLLSEVSAKTNNTDAPFPRIETCSDLDIGDFNAVAAVSKMEALGKKSSVARVNLIGIFESKNRIGCEVEKDEKGDMGNVEAGEMGHSKPFGSNFGPNFGPGLRPREGSLVPAIRILIVDDSVTSNKILSQILQREGCLVQCAEDGLACLIAVEKTEKEDAFDVIIMDDNMPKMSGRDATKILRERGYKGMICGVTGNTTPTDTLAFEAHGATMVLPKPLDTKLFMRKLTAHIKLSTSSLL